MLFEAASHPVLGCGGDPLGPGGAGRGRAQDYGLHPRRKAAPRLQSQHPPLHVRPGRRFGESGSVGVEFLSSLNTPPPLLRSFLALCLTSRALLCCARRSSLARTKRCAPDRVDETPVEFLFHPHCSAKPALRTPPSTSCRSPSTASTCTWSLLTFRCGGFMALLFPSYLHSTYSPTCPLSTTLSDCWTTGSCSAFWSATIFCRTCRTFTLARYWDFSMSPSFC